MFYHCIVNFYCSDPLAKRYYSDARINTSDAKINISDQDAKGQTILHHAILMKKFSKAGIIMKEFRGYIGKYHLINFDHFSSRNLQLCFCLSYTVGTYSLHANLVHMYCALV